LLEDLTLLDTVNRTDVGVIQGGEHPRFALESRQAFRIAGVLDVVSALGTRKGARGSPSSSLAA